MNKKTLLLFIERIVQNCNDDNSKLHNSLVQLRDILIAQKASPELVKIVADSIVSERELRLYEKKSNLTEEDIEILHRKALERIMREEEARRNGRC